MAKQGVLVYPVNEAEVLLGRHKREPFIDMLSGWGGLIEEEIDFSPRQAACREVFEESRVKIFPDDLVYVTMNYFYREGECLQCYIYFLPRWKGEFQETVEMTQGAYYPKGELPFDEMTQGDREWFPQLLAGDKTEYHVYHNHDWTLYRIDRKEVKAA